MRTRLSKEMSELINYINNIEVIGGLKYVSKNKKLNIEELSSLASLENLNYQDKDGYTALHWYLSVQFPNIDIVKLLITNENVNIETTLHKFTPVHLYIVYSDLVDLDIIKLLANSNNINKPYVYTTLLEYYIYNRADPNQIGKNNIVKYLIDIGGIIYDETLPEYYYYKCKCLQKQVDDLLKIKYMSCILENSVKKYL